jgi:hypothetical protein
MKKVIKKVIDTSFFVEKQTIICQLCSISRNVGVKYISTSKRTIKRFYCLDEYDDWEEEYIELDRLMLNIKEKDLTWMPDTSLHSFALYAFPFKDSCPPLCRTR